MVVLLKRVRYEIGLKVIQMIITHTYGLPRLVVDTLQDGTMYHPKKVMFRFRLPV